jgi:hypothetical protein
MKSLSESMPSDFHGTCPTEAAWHKPRCAHDDSGEDAEWKN